MLQTGDGRLFWPAAPQRRPDANFRSIDIARFDATAFYNSFQAMLDRRVTKGLAFQFNYTFGKCIDDASTPYSVNCFVKAEPGFLGNVGSRVLTGSKLVVSDWAMTKVQHLGEQRRLEFSAEAFNIFNHTNLATPRFVQLFNSDGSRIGSAGRITQTITTSRQVQFAIRFVF